MTNQPTVLFGYHYYTIVLLLYAGFLNIGRWPKGKPRLANFGLMDQVAGKYKL